MDGGAAEVRAREALRSEMTWPGQKEAFLFGQEHAQCSERVDGIHTRGDR